ncbi:DUF6888 family protein [Cylindrospermum sp. FACHB-282]|uniref:DUF6888 family protein n=1 Tax=Cylindrospermum sp. FACHB-282 TaxID=2692794 RepID=UPI0035CCCA86
MLLDCHLQIKIIYVTIEKTAINPTVAQAITCLRVCQMLSNCLRDIKGYVYILADDEIQIMILPSGEWRFIDEA